MEMESPIKSTRGSLGLSLIGARGPFLGWEYRGKDTSKAATIAGTFMCPSLAGVGLVASSFGVITIEGNAVFILERTAKDIQGTSDCQVYATLSGVVNRLKVDQ